MVRFSYLKTTGKTLIACVNKLRAHCILFWVQHILSSHLLSNKKKIKLR